MGYAYHVLPQGQSTRQILSPNGRGFVTVREVAGVIDSGPATGTRFDVQVYADGATVDTVREAIEREVEHLSEVANLSGPGATE